jgi:NAD(P)-dependent dehydrogenase (short-subunit alcohol dehydrogenase family)
VHVWPLKASERRIDDLGHKIRSDLAELPGGDALGDQFLYYGHGVPRVFAYHPLCRREARGVLAKLWTAPFELLRAGSDEHLEASRGIVHSFELTCSPLARSSQLAVNHQKHQFFLGWGDGVERAAGAAHALSDLAHGQVVEAFPQEQFLDAIEDLALSALELLSLEQDGRLQGKRASIGVAGRSGPGTRHPAIVVVKAEHDDVPAGSQHRRATGRRRPSRSRAHDRCRSDWSQESTHMSPPSNSCAPTIGGHDETEAARMVTTNAELFGLEGKRAVVTGGTRGIGLMVARGLLQAGASVVISSRKPDACEAARDALATFGQVQAIPMDLSEPQGCSRLAELVLGEQGTVDILVNNAGATWGASLESFPVAAWHKVLDLNLISPFLLVQAFLPGLCAAGTPDDPARVINIGSIDGIQVSGMPNYPYTVSKAGIHHLTRHLAKELGPRHITVNAVAPGPFESKMMAATLEQLGDTIAAAAPLRRIGRDDDMAGVTVFLASRAGAYLTGAVIPVDGGISTTASGV